jgi:hypothetical protein
VNPFVKSGILTLEAMFVAGGIGTVVVLICIASQVFYSMIKLAKEEEEDP